MTQLDLFPEHREHLTQPAGLEGNARKIIVSLFDYSGEWSRPYREAGYTVIQFDKQLDGIDLATTPPQEIADIIRDRLNRPAYEVWGCSLHTRATASQDARRDTSQSGTRTAKRTWLLRCSTIPWKSLNIFSLISAQIQLQSLTRTRPGDYTRTRA